MTEPGQGADLGAAFREAFRHHPSGVAIITADPGDGPVALTVSSLISVSLDPPTVAFSLSERSSTAAPMRRSETLVLHFARIENRALAELCATSGADRFGPGVTWDRLASGEPYYPEVRCRFRARILHELSVEGATLIVARLLDASHPKADPVPKEQSLVYLNRRWLGLRTLDADRAAE